MQKATVDPTGDSVFEYVVQPGDTFSTIAKRFAIPEWQAISRYNTLVHKLLTSPDPERLLAGKRILIPRSFLGYRRLVKKLLLLKDDLETAGMQEHWRLDALEAEQKATEIAYDAVASCLTILGSLFAKAATGAAEGAKAAVANARAVEGAAANAYWYRFASITNYADDVDEVFVTLNGRINTGLKGAAEGARKNLNTFAVEKAWDKGTEILLARKELALLRKLDKALVKKEFSGWRSYAESALDSAWAALDYLDYLKPSTWARMWATGVYWSLPKDLPNEADVQRKAIQRATAAAASRIEQQIKKVKAEAKTVWRIDIKD